ncbi:hypothetical protein H8L32_12605 [Undibacterium sp. CY18W]|uniref:ABC-2 type transport system permease protein n=1 Tax=Undibacterium hunanense TaxID=2762292 RepID=A0ABR6ZR80_9BURK|nr:hypothetical protein [Undibacterium hunanense]MBC3918324.1 hypothetical protein [Undibacterium hunanense]
MKKLMWLIRREYWENKAMLLWSNAAVAALLVIVFASLRGRPSYQFEGQVVEPAVMTAAQISYVIKGLNESFYLPLSLLGVLLPILIGVYCLGSLYNERDDRSVLFWKSMPVSGTTTVLSKVLFALLLFPLATLVFSLIAGIPIFLSFGIRLQTSGIQTNVFSAAFQDSDMLLTPLKMISLLPVYMLWALPTVGWLMMVSAWAKTKPILWAICIPMLTVWLIYIVSKNLDLGLNIRWLNFNIIGRGLMSILPASWIAYQKVDSPQIDYAHSLTAWSGDMYGPSLEMLGKSELWVGAIIGIAMLAVAVFLRQKRDVS